MTNKIALRTVEQFMSDYKPVYQPIYPLFLGKSQSYSEEAGKHEFRRVQTVGDIRAKHILPKDTEIREIGVNEAKKTFKKYFLANRYVHSNFQDTQGNEEVIAQVLDENQKLADDLLLLGEGTAGNNVVNNGLYWSGDSNYRLESSQELDSDQDLAKSLHTQVMANVAMAEPVSGRKVIFFYGTLILPIFDSLYTATNLPFKTQLSQVLGSGYSLVKLPAAVTPSSANGIIIANMDQVKLHYTALPKLQAQGVNEEKMYSWHNFMLGSMMLEVLQDDAIVRQPLTIEA